MERIAKILIVSLAVFFMQITIVHAQIPRITAKSAAVIDVQTGRILYAHNADQKMPIASLTKIMTAIVAIEEGDLKDKVKASKRAVRTEGSSIYLREGEEMTLEDLLYGLMLRSGNDAAVAIAEHIGGSIEGFAYLMNEKAQYIGLTSSHFVNPHGLDHPDHYSTARDLAILTAYALKNPTFQKIVATKVKTAPLEGYDWDRKWINKNKMLRMYKGADGVKTGYTKIAQRCLVSSATKDGRQIAVVVINDPNDWNDSARLLDYGFDQFHYVKLVEEGQQYTFMDPNTKKEITYVANRDSIYPLAENETDYISSEVIIQDNRILSYDAYLQISLRGEVIDQVPLKIAKEQETSKIISEQSLFERYWSFWIMFWRNVI